MPGSSVTPAAVSIRSLQVVVAAMTVGCILFLVVALAVVGGPGNPPEPPIVTYVMLALAGSTVLGRMVVPRIIVAQARRNIRQGHWQYPRRDFSATYGSSGEEAEDAAKLVVVFTTRTIIAAAMLEGAVFALLIAYMLERSSWSLAAAVALIVGLAAYIPTRSRAAAWTEEQKRLLDEERLLDRASGPSGW
jgi:hypothetical protein